MRVPKWKTGGARKDNEGPTSMEGRRSGRPCDLMWLSRSGSLRGFATLLRYSKSRIPSGRDHIRWDSSVVRPDDRKSSISPESSSKDERSVAGAGQRPRAIEDPLQDRVEIKALIDAQAGPRSAGTADL